MADSDQFRSNKPLCKLNELEAQMACISARPDNPQTEQDFREAYPLYQNENHTSDPFNSQTYQELEEKHQSTSLYLFGCLHLFTYNTENEREEAKFIEIPNYFSPNSLSIVQLPDGELFCSCKEYRSTFITFIINKNYEVRMLPSQKFYESLTAIYFRGNVYCFGVDEDSETLSYRFDLYRNQWFKLTPIPYGSSCNSALFNKNIFISEYNCENLMQYSIDIDSFSIIPHDFQRDCRKILINGEERLYLIEWAKNGFIYESEVGDEYNWKQIAKSTINQNCGQVYWIYNKRGIYISTLSKKCVREYYKFDLDQNALIGIAYYDKHIAIRKLGEKVEAIKCYNQTFNLNPQAALSFGKFTINDLGRKLEKIECCNQAIKLNPADANAYIDKGNALNDSERYLEAIECFDEAIKIDPSNYFAYHNKGYSLNALTRYREALECYNEELEINSNIPGAYMNKGRVLYNLNRYIEAVECLEESLKINPRLKFAQYYKGCAYYSLGRNLEALECFDEELKLDSYFADIYTMKGNARYSLQNYLEAIDCYNESIKFNPNEASHYSNKGDALYGLKRYLEAVECYTESIKLDPKDATVYTKKGHSLYELERFLEAIECYNEVIKIDPRNTTAYEWKGSAFSFLERYLEAIECFDEAIKINPNNSNTYICKGNILDILGRSLEAIECYDEAIKIDPKCAFAYNSKGDILNDLDRKLEAIVCYNEATKLDPDNPLIFFNKALAFNSLGQEAEALQDFYRGYYLIKESQTSDKFNLSQINSNFTNPALKNDFIELLQKFTQLGESSIGFKEEFNSLKRYPKSKLMKEIEKQEETIKEERSKLLMKAAGFFRPNNDDTLEEMQQKIYQVNREVDEYIKRVILTISDLRSSLQHKVNEDE